MDSIKKVCDVFDIPYESAGSIPRITVLGTDEAYIENFISLEDYKKETVKLKCKTGVIALFGENFRVKAIKEGCILITGRIKALEFI